MCLRVALVKVICLLNSLREQFRHLLKGVQHERPDVRLHALKALHKLLKSNRVGIYTNNYYRIAGNLVGN